MTSSLRYMLTRLLRLVLVLAAVAVVAFSLAKLSPIDPVDAYLGPDVARVGPEQRALIAEKWGLNQPPIEQFSHWARNLLSGDLGFSMTYNAPVAEVLASRVLASLPLMGLAWLLSGLLGFVLGILAGAYSGSLLDRVIRVYSFVLASTPTFWLAILLLVMFSVSLQWTPVCCAAPPGMLADEVSLWQRLHHLLLPLATLTLLGVAQIALHTRAKMVEIMQSDYALYARAQGASRLDIALRHGARNAALPALTVLFASIGELFGGSVLAEQVFAYPGLGRATVEAGIRGDIPLLLAITLFMTLLVSSGNMIADLLYRLVDPRMRQAETLEWSQP
ncbi:peptide/nickel transport system permease protein [Marinobacterium lutimaris]|uniref:Peptide/nickel transport system permease protein n=2 Tax=Marinobacterium lutimaris TaxID=568106 RepID=A0A1H5VFZ6_9GAMM|nr:peptide/nickel transport system permease protein [Marinobacterium lutimaris]